MDSAEKRCKGIVEDLPENLQARLSRISVYAVAAAYNLGFRNADLETVRAEATTRIRQLSGEPEQPELVPGLISLCIWLDDLWIAATEEQIENGALAKWLLESTGRGHSADMIDALVSVVEVVQPLRASAQEPAGN